MTIADFSEYFAENTPLEKATGYISGLFDYVYWNSVVHFMKNKMTESQKRKFNIIKNQQYIFLKPSQATLLSWQITKIEKTINNEIKKKQKHKIQKLNGNVLIPLAVFSLFLTLFRYTVLTVISLMALKEKPLLKNV